MFRLPLDVRPTARMVWRSRHVAGRQAFRVPGAWGMHLYPYRARVRRDGGPWREIAPGDAGFTPPGARMEYDWPDGADHVFAHLVWPPDAPVTGPELPEIFSVGSAFPSLWASLEEALPWRLSDPRRADVRAWDVLLGLVERARPRGDAPPEAVRRALAILERRLAEPVSVEAVAREVGVSRAHLARLFRTHTGETVVGTLGRRRMARAAELLRGTDLPVKVVGALVGMPDPQAFHKAYRRAWGRPPSAER